ncbi:6-bladed beta-propeller [candidate division KSB1 bacterium]
MRTRLFVLLIFTAFLFNCSDETQNTNTVEEVDGVRFVHNTGPLWGDEPKVGLEFVRQIGDLETTDENLMFGSASDIEKDSNGNLYIPAGNAQIRIFDRDLKYLRSFGRRGEGPGEFGGISKIIFSEKGRIFVADFWYRQLHIFDKDRKFIKRTPIIHRAEIARADSKGNLVLQRFGAYELGDLFRGSSLPEEIALLYEVDENGGFVRDLCNMKIPENQLYINAWRDLKFALDSKNNIYIVYEKLDAIDKFSPDGNLILRFDRPLDYPYSFPYADDFLMKDRKGVSDDNPGEYYMKHLNTPLVSMNIDVDSKDRIWVLSLTREFKNRVTIDDPANTTVYKFDIFTNEGVYLGSVPIYTACTNLRIFDDTLFIMNYEEACFYEYRIVEK